MADTASVRERLRQAIERHEMLSAGETVVVGVSGGPDSLCLLHALRALAPSLELGLHVGHLNHGIRGAEADADARFVAELCAQWGIPCAVEHRDVPALAANQKRSLEETARQARYAFLGELAVSVGSSAVAVAHNADDQSETVLMHLLRGSGLAGLRGMLPVTPLRALRLSGLGAAARDVRLLRPLLGTPRADIEAYCHDNGLAPRFDRSNLDTTLFRNRLRYELLPMLETYNPNIRQVLQRTAQVAAGDYALLWDLQCESWARTVVAENPTSVAFDLGALRALEIGMQRALLREAVRKLRASLRDIDWVHIEIAVDLIRSGRVGNKATLPAGLELRLGYQQATLCAAGSAPPEVDAPRVTERMALGALGQTALPGGRWQLQIETLPVSELPEGWAQNPDPYLAYLDADRLGDELYLRPRESGDRFAPLGMAGHQTVRAFMTNAHVPAAHRDRVPLLISGGQIAWVVGWRIADPFAVSHDTIRVAVIRFYHNEEC